MEQLQGLSPAFPDQKAQTVPIVLSSSESFAPVCAVAICSIVSNASDSRYYDILVLDTGISPENQQKIQSLAKENVSIRFYNVRELLNQYNLKTLSHVPTETYARFIDQSVFQDYDKIIHLDTDVICDRDVAELFDIKLDSHLLAAARDPDMCGCLNLFEDREVYLRTRLKMEHPYDYFQAGVLSLNAKEMRKLYSTEQWLDLAQEDYMYVDQDVLNRYCQGRVLYLDMAWDVLIDCMEYRVPVIIQAAPERMKKDYFAARETPFVIHYAGGEKPWNQPNVDMEAYFWKYAKETPYYEMLQKQRKNGAPAAWIRKQKRKVKRFVKGVACGIFPAKVQQL